MQPLKFKGHNCVYAESQPEYLPLPAYRDSLGLVTTCWKLSWKERVKIFFKGSFWLSVYTFGQPLQPLLPEVNSPLKRLKND